MAARARVAKCCLIANNVEYIDSPLSNSTEYISRGSRAEWLACWTQALKDPGSNRSRDVVG